MFNSVALQAVTGLIFIYLLYSLLATVLSEMIASVLRLRARNLITALGRMLKSHNNQFVLGLLNNPEIKVPGETGVMRYPSFIRATNFSRALMKELFGDGPVTGEKISAVLEKETAGYLLGLWKEAQGDVLKFRLLIEDWFNRTMEHASEWYKRKIQLVLLILGFCIAWFFCADTFTMARKLSVDKDAREKMVTLAETYARENPLAGDTALLEVKKTLAADMSGANSVLGLGGWLPDNINVVTDPVTSAKSYSQPLDTACISPSDLKILNGKIAFSFGDKMAYLLKLAWHHFFGFLITAIAISLGAPFWFDLLNKIMKLRSSVKEKPEKKTEI